jgi:uncharacterized protein
VLAGAIGSAGGIASLISFPALLAVGVPPLAANATNIVALTMIWPGAGLSSRPELEGWGRWLSRWLPVMLAGGALGAGLLLGTPEDAFKRVVPFLVVAGSLALVCVPWLRRHRTSPVHHPLALAAWLLLMATYGGYFGAGSGVMVLALLLIMVDQRLPTANALKNILVGVGTIPAALLLAFLAPVHWPDAGILAVGALAGSRAGPSVARNVPAVVLRWVVFALGIALAVQLSINPTV